MFAWLHTRPGAIDVDLARGDFANLLSARRTIAQLFAAAYPYAASASAAQVPTTIAWSAHDHVLLPYQARQARRLLPDARHVTLPGVGHVPMPDDPDLVVRTIREGARPAEERLSSSA
jgi:pimeloyl-ACP methyl ester carboxylesterase